MTVAMTSLSTITRSIIQRHPTILLSVGFPLGKTPWTHHRHLPHPPLQSHPHWISSNPHPFPGQARLRLRRALPDSRINPRVPVPVPTSTSSSTLSLGMRRMRTWMRTRRRTSSTLAQGALFPSPRIGMRMVRVKTIIMGIHLRGLSPFQILLPVTNLLILFLLTDSDSFSLNA